MVPVQKQSMTEILTKPGRDYQGTSTKRTRKLNKRKRADRQKARKSK